MPSGLQNLSTDRRTGNMNTWESTQNGFCCVSWTHTHTHTHSVDGNIAAGNEYQGVLSWSRIVEGLNSVTSTWLISTAFWTMAAGSCLCRLPNYTNSLRTPCGHSCHYYGVCPTAGAMGAQRKCRCQSEADAVAVSCPAPTPHR